MLPAPPASSLLGGRCIYLPDLLPEAVHQAIVAEYEERRSLLTDEGPCAAKGRRAMVAPRGGAAERAFADGELLRALPVRCKLKRIGPLARRDDVPIEYREYGPGSSVTWHVDSILTDPPQIELVYTVENDSDSRTRWTRSHMHMGRDLIHEVWTAPNSALLVVAGEGLHAVKELTKGRRTIAKVLLAAPDAKFVPKAWEKYKGMMDFLT